jgi:hypothetical protein
LPKEQGIFSKLNKRLRELNLEATKLGDQGCLQVLESLKVNCILKKVNLSNNSITCKSGNFKFIKLS